MSLRAAVAALLLSCAACTQFSNPIVAESGPALDPALVGRWEAEHDGETMPWKLRAMPMPAASSS